MRTTRRRFLALAGGAVAAPGAVARGLRPGAAGDAQAAPFPAAGLQRARQVPDALGRKVEADSNGRIKIDIFPSMQLGGTPPQLFDQARDGVVDIVWTLPGYTPGRFPIIEAFELPFVGARRGVVNSQGVAGILRDATSRRRVQARCS